jgi:hypothetical protein
MFQWRISQSMKLKPSCYSCPAFSTDRTVLVDCWASQKETTKWQHSEQPMTRTGHDTDQMESTYKFAIGSNTCVISGICNQCKLPTSGPICIICWSSPIRSSCTWPTPLHNVKTYSRIQHLPLSKNSSSFISWIPTHQNSLSNSKHLKSVCPSPHHF